jgi:hypothetical protein
VTPGESIIRASERSRGQITTWRNVTVTGATKKTWACPSGHVVTTSLNRPRKPCPKCYQIAVDQCLGCGGPHLFDTSVPSVQWNAVIRAAGLPDYLCTACVVRAFVTAGVSFSASLWGAGFSGIQIEVRVNGKESAALQEVEDENNRLRVELRAQAEQAGVQ